MRNTVPLAIGSVIAKRSGLTFPESTTTLLVKDARVGPASHINISFQGTIAPLTGHSVTQTPGQFVLTLAAALPDPIPFSYQIHN